MKLVAAGALAFTLIVAPAAQTPRFRSNVAVVRVDALVTDGRRPIGGLTAANFELRDNGVLQKIVDVHFETLPLNIFCVLDVSASVEGHPLLQLKDGMSALIDTLTGGDRAALLTFSNRLQLHTRLTGDRDRLRSAAKAVKATGSTALFDAIFAGLALREADEGRPLMLLFSDGKDTASWLSASKVIDAARRTDVVVYIVAARSAVALQPPWTRSLSSRLQRPSLIERAAEHFLEELADATGGRVVFTDIETPLREIFLDTLDEFRRRYVISYQPTDVAAGGWHAIDVRLRGRSGQVKARRGYADSR